MIYLLDANVLISAHNSYYPISVVPEFWEWLIYQAEKGTIKMPQATFDELKGGSDKRNELLAWSRQPEVVDSLLMDESADPALVRRVLAEGYGEDLTDSELDIIGRDPFLIAHVLVDPENRVVVTTEVSKPSRLRQNKT